MSAVDLVFWRISARRGVVLFYTGRHKPSSPDPMSGLQQGAKLSAIPRYIFDYSTFYQGAAAWHIRCNSSVAKTFFPASRIG
jgi:hypothetical protein